MLIIPHNTLSQEALLGVLDDFINREGTDYGYESGYPDAEPSLEAKRQRLLTQLEQKKIVVTFDPATQSTTLISATEADI